MLTTALPALGNAAAAAEDPLAAKASRIRPLFKTKGPPRAGDCILRTAMTATHETGHMFGIRHCVAFECGMNGSNHADERDRQPLEFCPECQPLA